MSANENGAAGVRPDCNRCTAFFITHQPAFPYGCRSMGFRSARLPCLVVLEAAGIPCQQFDPKPVRKPD